MKTSQLTLLLNALYIICFKLFIKVLGIFYIFFFLPHCLIFVGKKEKDQEKQLSSLSDKNSFNHFPPWETKQKVLNRKENGITDGFEMANLFSTEYIQQIALDYQSIVKSSSIRIF